MLKRALVIAILILTVVSLVGCGANAVTKGGQRRPKLYGRVVSLSPSTTEVVNMNGMFAGLVGKTTADNYPMNVKNVKNVVKDTEINYELVKEANPDLIVYDPALYPDTKLEKLKEMGIKLFPFGPHTYDEYREGVAELGQLIGQEGSASDMLDKLYGVIQVEKGRMPEKGISTTVLIGGTGTDYSAAGTGTCQADFFRQINLDYKGPDADNFAPVNIETIIGWNPDMIIGTDESATAILKDPRLANLTAVKEGRVYGITDDVILRVGTRVNLLLQAVGQQAQRIYSAKNKTN